MMDPNKWLIDAFEESINSERGSDFKSKRHCKLSNGDNQLLKNAQEITGHKISEKQGGEGPEFCGMGQMEFFGSGTTVSGRHPLSYFFNSFQCSWPLEGCL